MSVEILPYAIEDVPSEFRERVLALMSDCDSGSVTMLEMLKVIAGMALPGDLWRPIAIEAAYKVEAATPKAKARRVPPPRPYVQPAYRVNRGSWTPRLAERDWLPLTGLIYRRDGLICSYCNATDEPLCIDHVVPLSRGGSNDTSNLVVACIPCNSSKCDRLLSEWGGRYGVRR